MITALIDGDPMKYAVASACQKEVWVHDTRGRVLLAQNSDRFIEAYFIDEDKTEATIFRKKAEVADLFNLKDKYIATDDMPKVIHSVKMMLNRCIKLTGATDYRVFLSRGECFRSAVYPEYKANRKDLEKPVLIPQIEEYLIKHHGAEVCTYIEADDAMGINQFMAAIERGGVFPYCWDSTVICTIDKDLRMIPGWHFNPNSAELSFVDEEQGLRNFWMQVLTGDKVDNIPGLDGIGPAKAAKLLDGVPVKDMRDACLQAYIDHGHDEGFFRMNCILLWMLRKPLAETYPGDYTFWLK